MRLSLRALQLATVILYMGPLLGGLAGFGWGLVPPFLSIFVLWLVLLRPQQWPQAPGEWLRPQAWAVAFSQVLSQVVLVAVLFGIGRGIGGVMGTLPLFHPLLPVAVSFLAIPLLRLVWDTDRALAEGLSVDELLYPHAAPPKRPSAFSTAPADAEVAIAPLLALDARPEQALSPADLRAAIEETLDDEDAWQRLAALTLALSSAPTERHRSLRAAVIDWATDPVSTAARSAPGALRAAFAAAGGDDGFLRILVPRAQALAEAASPLAAGLPDPAVIEDIARRGVAADVASGLSKLALGLKGGLRRVPAVVPARLSLPRGASVGAR